MRITLEFHNRPGPICEHDVAANVIYVNADAFDALSAEDQRFILMHEVGHARLHDEITQIFQLPAPVVVVCDWNKAVDHAMNELTDMMMQQPSIVALKKPVLRERELRVSGSREKDWKQREKKRVSGKKRR